MTIGKVTKKDSRLFARTYKFMKKNTDNLTLKDFADLIEFMNESDERGNNGGGGQQGAAGRQGNRPILGLGHFLDQRSQAARLNNQVPNPVANRQRAALTYKRNDWPAPPAPERKRENDVAITTIQPPGGRVRVEYLEQ